MKEAETKVRKLCSCVCHDGNVYAYCQLCEEKRCGAFKMLLTKRIKTMVIARNKCFLCNKNLTNQVKVFSYHNFRNNFDLDQRNPLCSDCAKKDLEVAHAEAVKPVIKYKKILGRLVWLK